MRWGLKTTNKDGTRTYDGIIGSETLEALAEAVRRGKLVDVNNDMAIERIEALRKDPNYRENPGWLPRALEFLMNE